ncbi:MAG: septal ring lytic transglycosylase RlpA family protein [Desulfobacteraceae bacterium]|nr:septal ring lytic transglycosylase RlpA family protein [Desulfobacteraceae bacterium]
MFGCSTKIETTPAPHQIPPDTSKKPTKPYQKPGKTPATQKPYTIMGQRYTPIASAEGFSQKGYASWYGKKFHGRKTSNGERYDMYAMTAAHKTLPMNTWVRVHNLKNNRQIMVRINDRGPFVASRIIDLSYTGAKKLGVVGPGTAPVKIVALGRANTYSTASKKPTSFSPVDYWKGNFTVQVGAFQIRQNAKNYRNKLSRTYSNAHIVTYTDYRGTFYRVRIGKFTNLKDALRFRDKVTDTLGHCFTVAE